MSTRKPITASQITALNELLEKLPTPHNLITPSSPDYRKTIQRWSSAAEKPAGASLIPESVAAISTAVAYATSEGLDLAVRGGGHSTAGASSTDGGLLIDLGSSKKFTEVDVDTATQRLAVGGGAVWGQVDQAGFKAGLATVGGTVADTGVGGLTLGGGYGWLSGKLGLTIDQLVSVTLVLASGAVVVASKEENPDLFWGLRGAGQNFGVAVMFVLQGHPFGSGPVEKRIGGADGGQAYVGMLMWPPQKLAEVIAACNKIYRRDNSLDANGAGSIAFARPPPARGQLLVIKQIIWLGDKASGDEAYKDLLDLDPVMNTMAMVDYPTMNSFMGIPYGLRVSMKGAAFNLPISVTFAQQVLDQYAKFTEEVNDAAGSMLLFELYDPSKVVASASNTDMAFGNRGYHFNAMVGPMWTQAENDDRCRQWARDMAALFKEQLKKDGEVVSKGNEYPTKKSDVGAVMMYGNYDQYDENSNDVFGANYDRLQRLKAQYDPTNTFYKLFGIKPLALP
ncbi:FAD-binding domain-containing protein [Pseudovirgaria hyperparasitica]|uniref:FAD-binding domain-containing protein n=1 Tax=Pseudovirgaria hyperparasitica TaxID=470096 RepID=A0A6A6W6Q9_9PEZI|nr:FAD-binding domain-containing protein [Pseudovirgaria hyperparasitica]KAF2758568.1 FAD-binding domain-containing protein [Pseudovirgaria hyperparasitica]